MIFGGESGTRGHTDRCFAKRQRAQRHGVLLQKHLLAKDATEDVRRHTYMPRSQVIISWIINWIILMFNEIRSDTRTSPAHSL